MLGGVTAEMSELRALCRPDWCKVAISLFLSAMSWACGHVYTVEDGPADGRRVSNTSLFGSASLIREAGGGLGPRTKAGCAHQGRDLNNKTALVIAR